MFADEREVTCLSSTSTSWNYSSGKSAADKSAIMNDVDIGFGQEAFKVDSKPGFQNLLETGCRMHFREF